MTPRILIVDDDADLRSVFRTRFEHVGYDVETAGSGEDALAHVSKAAPDVVITDLRMPGMSGLDLLKRVKDSTSDIDVILVTGHEDMSSAVAAMREGAFDYVVKPVDLKGLAGIVERCLSEQELNRKSRAEEQDSAGAHVEEGSGVVGRDPRMIEIYKTIGVLARNRTTVLIRGETGTGKEMIARAVHNNSSQADEPFIAVNCTALSDSLLESELFGHVKGAFTGAVGNRRGYFELARNGTIFLDEIGDTSPEFQTKLLRVLQERQFYPVGGESPRTTEARVIAATHQPIEARVHEGVFREDLYFRLKVVQVRVPPLRERRDDIPLLAEALLARIRRETDADVRHIAEDAMAMLLEYRWPGNVRELENALTRAAILARGTTLSREHLSLGNELGPAIEEEEGGGEHQVGDPSDRSLNAAIARHVYTTLTETDWNKSKASRVLKISRSRLQRLVDKFDLEEVRDEAEADSES